MIRSIILLILVSYAALGYALPHSALANLKSRYSAERMQAINDLLQANSKEEQLEALLALVQHAEGIHRTLANVEKTPSPAAREELRELNTAFYQDELEAGLQAALVLATKNELVLKTAADEYAKSFVSPQLPIAELLAIKRPFWEKLCEKSRAIRDALFAHPSAWVKQLALRGLLAIPPTLANGPELLREVSAQLPKVFRRGNKIPLYIWWESVEPAVLATVEISRLVHGDTPQNDQVRHDLRSKIWRILQRMANAPIGTERNEERLSRKLMNGFLAISVLLPDKEKKALVQKFEEITIFRGWSSDSLELLQATIEFEIEAGCDNLFDDDG